MVAPLQRLGFRFGAQALLWELTAHPELWDRHKARTQAPVFEGTHDIWVRFRPWEELKGDWNTPHFAVWYPAARDLPSVFPIVFNLMNYFKAEHLGGILITKIPPGAAVRPHTDSGWHAEFYNRKVYGVLETNPKCYNRHDKVAMALRAGEAYLFDNLVEHEVVNGGTTDRISLIVCMRCDDGPIRTAC